MVLKALVVTGKFSSDLPMKSGIIAVIILVVLDGGTTAGTIRPQMLEEFPQDAMPAQPHRPLPRQRLHHRQSTAVPR